MLLFGLGGGKDMVSMGIRGGLVTSDVITELGYLLDTDKFYATLPLIFSGANSACLIPSVCMKTLIRYSRIIQSLSMIH